ncbi:hypothetical protein GCM10027347_58650 [Larkinella harenae]
MLYDQLSDYYDVYAYVADSPNYEVSGLTTATPSDPKLTADLKNAKDQAAAKGDSKALKLINDILTYGDKFLTILSKNGIIKNKNLVTAYPSYASLLGTGTTTGTDTTTNNAPATGNRVFNIDFTDPKVLIITFLLVMILFYFLFFNPSKNGKR